MQGPQQVILYYGEPIPEITTKAILKHDQSYSQAMN